MHHKSHKPAKRREAPQLNNLIDVIKLNPSIFILGIVFGLVVGFVFTEPFYKVPSLPNFFHQSQSNS